MPTYSKQNSSVVNAAAGLSTQAALVGFGLGAPVATFAIAVSSLSQDVKVSLLVIISAAYAGICLWAYNQIRRIRAIEDTGQYVVRDENASDLERKLLALEDAREFFGTSLKPADMFRLVANRINEIVPIGTCVLFVKDPDTGMLRSVQSYGANAKLFENLDISADESLAGLSYLSSEIETTGDLDGERGVFPTDTISGMASSAAIPLTHEGDAFAVFQIFFGDEDILTAANIDKLHAIAERISPLFLGSMAFERSLTNALTDPLTKLPNERAFHLVLENQLAESHRFRDERPLTVLAIDIKNFEEMNKDHGHAVGDRALSYAAEKISSQLRKMDFLARSMNDEFLVVLPKASERTAIEITGRIQACLAGAPMTVADDEQLKLWLNFGWATFWKDGETAQQLLQGAYTRKQQAKSEEPGNVVMFRKEYVN